MTISFQYSEIFHHCMGEAFYLPSCTITDVPTDVLQNLRQIKDLSDLLCSLFDQALRPIKKRIQSINKTDLSEVVFEENSVKLIISKRDYLQLEFLGTLKPIELFQRYTANKIAGHVHKAFTYLYILADQTHDNKLLVDLGNCYETGQGVEQNLAEAVECYKQAADQGSAEAHYQLGNCYLVGNGVGKDLTKAYSYYLLAANKGNENAECDVGLCYYGGRGVNQDLRQAFTYLNRSALKGHLVAQYFVGLCYYLGKGVQKDLAKSASWMKLSADQGYGVAQVDLGVSYYQGEGCNRNDQKAAQYFALASDRGLPEGQYNLGHCYYDGHGVGRDRDKAIHYYQQAADQGYDKAIKKLNDIKNREESPSNSLMCRSALSYSPIEASRSATGGSSIKSVMKNRVGRTLSSLSSSPPSACHKSKLSVSAIPSSRSKIPKFLNQPQTEIQSVYHRLDPRTKKLRRHTLDPNYLKELSALVRMERSVKTSGDDDNDMEARLSRPHQNDQTASESTDLTDFASASTSSEKV